MDDGFEDKDTKRKTRNLSEKKRRDQFNTLVNEVNTMVSPGRKMDKSTVLKTAIALLKKHNEMTLKSRVSEIEENWKPKFLTNEEFIYLLLEAVDGFIIIFSTSGQIFYISESVVSLLGYMPDNLVQMTIFEIAHEAERTNLYNILMNPPREEEQVSFSCYIRRRGADITQCSYELVNFIGIFRPERNRFVNDNNIDFPDENNLRLIFMGTGRILTPQLIRETAITDSSKAEFLSRHSLEWKFLFLDHRAPPIIGYLPFELLGTSGYDYYHVDDLEEVMKCHAVLMQRGEGTSCYYRFLTKGQQWIWLQTRFYITYHQWNSKPEFIVCSHRVVNYSAILMKDEGIIDEGFSSMPWSQKTSKIKLHKVAFSDCTSMSADSPGSRHSAITQNSMKSCGSFDGRHRRSQSRMETSQFNIQEPQTTAPAQNQQQSQQQLPQLQQPQQQQPQQQQQQPHQKLPQLQLSQQQLPQQQLPQKQQPQQQLAEHQLPKQPLHQQPLHQQQLPQQQLPQKQLPQQQLAEHQLPKQQLHQQQIPQQQLPQQQLPQQQLHQQKLPQQQLLQQQVPQQQLPQQQLPQQQLPQQQLPQQQLAPQQLTPQQLTPQQLAPQQLAPQQLAPQQLASQQIAPQLLPPQQLAPQLLPQQQIAPQQLAPQQLASQQLASQQLPQQQLPLQQQFIEQKHYITAITMPHMIASFPSPTVLTLGENVMMSSPAQNQMQTDLQRKHAELQASIEQKQAELRHVSEQLVMARLGIFPSQHGQQSDVNE